MQICFMVTIIKSLKLFVYENCTRSALIIRENMIFLYNESLIRKKKIYTIFNSPQNNSINNLLKLS